MQFVLIAKDGTDPDAPKRRLDNRAAHLAGVDANKPHMIMGGATINDAGQMDGSILIVDFPSREEFDKWLKADPYVVNGVWKDITVKPFRVAPNFQDKL